MAANDHTFHDMKRLHRWMAGASLALLAATAWMIADDHWRPWREYQHTYREHIDPWAARQKVVGVEKKEPEDTTGETSSSTTNRLLGLPIIDALGRPLSVEQIWLPELTIDYNFRDVARVDRCITCHQAIDRVSPDDPLQRSLSDEATLKSMPRGTCGTRYSKRPLPDAEMLAGEWGLKNPYRPHPRGDLFVGAGSPHPMGEFGCTICHDGQGSATGFAWASHTPNYVSQRNWWQRAPLGQDHGWFDNRHWDFPMLPRRFAESRCLRCHHEVTELAPSRRFPDPPAPKLTAGYDLVRSSGCFGCHEIKGYDTSGKRIGPDMRLELLGDVKDRGGTIPPGKMRRIGPSLRHTATKLDTAMVADRIADPMRFLPDTRMPRLYGLHEHLDKEDATKTRRREAIELRAIATYLEGASQRTEDLPRVPLPRMDLEPADTPSEVTAAISRGKRLFELSGCLACHPHSTFPDGKATQGPDLNSVAMKYGSPSSQDWLVAWLRDPASLSPRTLMPNVLLDSETSTGDPVVDIATYLLWTAVRFVPQAMPKVDEECLDSLTLSHLRGLFPEQEAADIVGRGIPPTMADDVVPDVRELAAPITVEKKLRFVGRRTIAKRGCYGCHDIPGFEDAQPIGPELTGWGRKQESLLAFEEVLDFANKRDWFSDKDLSLEEQSRQWFFHWMTVDRRRAGFAWQKLLAPRGFDYNRTHTKGYHQRLTMGQFDFSSEEREAIITFLLALTADPPVEKYVYQPVPEKQAIVEGRKVLDRYACAACHTLEMERWTFDLAPDAYEGVLETDDFDFMKPQLSEENLAASLQLDNRGLARAEIVGMPQLDEDGNPLWVDDDEDDHGNAAVQYGFMLSEPAAILGETWTVGGPDVLVWGPESLEETGTTKKPTVEDEGNSPHADPKPPVDISYFGSWLTNVRPPRGGDFARLIYAPALADAEEAGSTAAMTEAWGWLPPPLVNEGAMVRPEWLHDYLLNPTVIRPAAVSRMPKFTMSSAEATQLVDYFAATAGADAPYTSDSASRHGSTGAYRGDTQRWDLAMQLMTDATTYCAKCHLIGDYSPGGEIRTILAPNLDRVGRRLRPEYIRRWLANPRAVVPYTPMPVNFPSSGQPMGQDLFPGSSLEQLDAVVDLLIDYDEYLRRQFSIRRRVGPASEDTENSQGISPE